MEKTIFEKIIAGEIPCYKVYEDEETFAFLDINPKSLGHTLVVPKTHYPNLYEIPSELLAQAMDSAQKIAVSIKKSLGADGIKIVINNDEAAGQVVFHLHIHVIPYYKNGLGAKHYQYSDGEAEEVADRIAQHLS